MTCGMKAAASGLETTSEAAAARETENGKPRVFFLFTSGDQRWPSQTHSARKEGALRYRLPMFVLPCPDDVTP